MDLEATIKKVKPHLAPGSIKNYLIYIFLVFNRSPSFRTFSFLS